MTMNGLVQLIAPDVKIGENVRLIGYVNLYGCTINDNTKIGNFVEIQKNAYIGKFCKISSHSFVCEGVTIEDRVFVGHGVIFTNDRFPRATAADGTLQTDADWTCIPTLVKENASIGSGATVLCGVTIGRHALVGAGSVVTKDVPDHGLVCGNPAEQIGWVCICGQKLVFSRTRAICQCGRSFAKRNRAIIAEPQELNSLQNRCP